MIQTLLVADIDDHPVEIADDARTLRRQMQAAVRHRHQQTHRFQHDGLAAGIRPGDDQHRFPVGQTDGQRNDARNGFFLKLQQQLRVIRALQGQYRLIDQLRRRGVERRGKLSGGQRKINPGQRVDQPVQIVQMSAYRIGDGAQQNLVLPFDLAVQGFQPVIVTDRLHRLDQRIAAAAAGAAAHALELVGMRGFDGQHRTHAVPLDATALVEKPDVFGRGHQGVQLRFDGRLHLLTLLVQLGELGGCVVAQTPCRIDRAVQRLDQRCRRFQILDLTVQSGIIGNELPVSQPDLHQCTQIVQGAGRQSRSRLTGLSQRSANIGHILHPRQQIRIDDLPRRRHRRLHAARHGKIGRRLQMPRCVCAVRGKSQALQYPPYAVKLQHLQIALHKTPTKS